MNEPKSLFFEYQDKCLDYVINSEKSKEQLDKMNKLYDIITLRYGSGKHISNKEQYDIFMNLKWKIVYSRLIRKSIDDKVGEVYRG